MAVVERLHCKDMDPPKSCDHMLVNSKDHLAFYNTPTISMHLWNKSVKMNVRILKA